MSESSFLQLMLPLGVSRGTEPRAGAVPRGAAHPAGGLRLWPLLHAGSTEQAGAAQSTVFATSSLRSGQSELELMMPPFSSCLSPPCMYVGSLAPTLGILARLAVLFPAQRTVGHGRRPPALSTSRVASPHFPARDPHRFIPLGSRYAAYLGQAPNVSAQPAPSRRTRRLPH